MSATPDETCEIPMDSEGSSSCGVEVSSSEGDIQSDVDYYEIKQHPRVKKLREKYDINHKYDELSVIEKIYFDRNYNAIEFAAFLKVKPMRNYKVFSTITNNVRVYALYRLMKENKIKLYSFDNTATLTSLKISPVEEVIVPNSGTFVIEYKKLNLILQLNVLNCGVEWDWYLKTAQDFSKFNKILKEAMKKYNQYNLQVFDNKGIFLKLPEATFEDIVLSEDIRVEVQANIVDYIDSQKVEIKRKNGLPAKRGVIMEGAPGTGKTFLSRVLANTLNITFIVVTDLKYSDEIDHIFEFTKFFERVIVLFEDIDVYIGHREHNKNNDIISALLNKLDGFEANNHLITLCTTNDLNALDDALKDRPGRFDRILHFEAPDSKLKIEMLKNFCNGKDVNNIDFSKVIRETPEDCTGAYLKEVYITAVNEAIENDNIDDNSIVMLTTDIFLSALKKLSEAQKEVRSVGFDK